MKINKIATAIATGAVLLNALAPMAFAETVVVSENGAGSQSQINSNSNNTQSVSQSNNANISNVVVSSATTGGNTANANTGGDVHVTSGPAASTVNVTNAANTNTANLSGNCGTCQGGSDVLGIVGNGAGSAQAINANKNNTTSLGQSNNAHISNLITSDASTGGNDASANTGGDVVVTAGYAVSNVSVANAANVNSAHIGSIGGGAGVAGGDTVLISGNGAGSQSQANLNENKSVSLGQTNSAVILNSVFSNAATGGNSAVANTGGDVHVTSGPAVAKATITNMPNFNVASLHDCGCTTTGDLLKIAGNGAGAVSAINANHNNALSVGTTNNEVLSNFAIPTASTGGNDASANTAGYGLLADPSVTSGGALTEVTIANGGNVNNVGNGAMTLPGLGQVSFTSNFSGMWASWMAFMSASM